MPFWSRKNLSKIKAFLNEAHDKAILQLVSSDTELLTQKIVKSFTMQGVSAMQLQTYLVHFFHESQEMRYKALYEVRKDMASLNYHDFKELQELLIELDNQFAITTTNFVSEVGTHAMSSYIKSTPPLKSTARNILPFEFLDEN